MSKFRKTMFFYYIYDVFIKHVISNGTHTFILSYLDVIFNVFVLRHFVEHFK